MSGFLRQAGVRSTLALPGKSQKGVGGPRETRSTRLALREALREAESATRLSPPLTCFPGYATANRSHPNLHLPVQEPSERFLRRRRASRWAKDARAAGAEDKRNHYQVFFAEDSTEAPRRGRPFLNLSHCGRSHSETTRNDVYMHCEHFENKRKQKL